MVGGQGEKVCDAWINFIMNGLLSFADCWLGKEFEVLNIVTVIRLFWEDY